jgi:hypothetical protein
MVGSSVGASKSLEGVPASQFRGMWDRGMIAVGDTFVETSKEEAMWGWSC